MFIKFRFGDSSCRYGKESHPDRNRDREEWAHNRTMDLIEASRELRKYIARFGPDETVSGWASSATEFYESAVVDAAYDTEDSGKSEWFEDSIPSSSCYVRMQLLHSETGNNCIRT